MIIIKDYMFFSKKIFHVDGQIKNIFSAFIFVFITFSVPYMLKVTVDTFSQERSSENAYQLLAIILLYNLIWTTNQLLQWFRSLLVAPLIAKCNSISQVLLYLHIIKVRYDIVKSMDIGLLYSTGFTGGSEYP